MHNQSHSHVFPPFSGLHFSSPFLMEHHHQPQCPPFKSSPVNTLLGVHFFLTWIFIFLFTSFFSVPSTRYYSSVFLVNLSLIRGLFFTRTVPPDPPFPSPPFSKPFTVGDS